MKQHITPKQAKQLTETQFYNLFDEIVPRKDWFNYHHKKVTIGKLIEVIRKYNQVEVCSLEKFWNIQLFDLKFSTKEHIYSNTDDELIDVLFHALTWILDHHKI
jgi:hypothetical protein